MSYTADSHVLSKYYLVAFNNEGGLIRVLNKRSCGIVVPPSPIVYAGFGNLKRFTGYLVTGVVSNRPSKCAYETYYRAQ